MSNNRDQLIKYLLIVHKELTTMARATEEGSYLLTVINEEIAAINHVLERIYETNLKGKL